MNKKILITTTLALAMCMPFAFAKPSMAACEGSESCKTSHQAGCDEKCEDVNCCPVQVGDKCFPSLEDAVANTTSGEITLRKDVELSKNLQVSKTITINGKGYTIKPSSSFPTTEADKSLITATGSSGKLTLTNVKLDGSKAYGAQAYGGAELTLDGVEVSNCAGGAIHANGGTVKVKSLTLGPKNGKYWYIGIEVSNGKGVEQDPKIVMDGEIINKSGGNKNIIYSPQFDGTAHKFDVENTANSPQKIYVKKGDKGNEVYVVSGSGEIIFESTLPKAAEAKVEEVTENGDKVEAKNYVITIRYNGNTLQRVIGIEGVILVDLLDGATMAKINEGAPEGQECTHFITEDGSIYDTYQIIKGDLTVIAVYEPIPENTTPVEPTPEQTEVPSETNPSGDETDDEPDTGVPSNMAAYAIGLLSLVGVVATRKFLK